MSIKWKTVKNRIPEIKLEMEKLNGKSIEVGVFEGENRWLAAIHEYGCDIRAKNAKYLTVPIHPKARNKKARDFKDLFTVRAKSGNLFLAQKVGKGKDKGKVDFLFWLAEKVTIPERSFLRKGHDEYIKEVMKYSDRLLGQVVAGNGCLYEYRGLCKSH